VFQDVVMTNEARTVTSVVTFSASPVVPTATNAGDAINKSQLDLAVLGTVPASSTTVLGAVRVATDPTKTLGTATMTIASPCVVTFNAHGLTANDTVRFTTSGALPTGLVVGTTYYVIATGLTVNTFQLSATAGGSAINTSGGQSGTHTLYRTTPYAVNDQDPKLPTQGENDALVGNNTDIAVGTGNKYVTQTGLQKASEKYAVISSGSSTTYSLTLSPVPTSYVAGMEIIAKIDVANTTTTPTLNVNGLGAKTIIKGTSTALIAGDLIINQIARFVYDGTNMVLKNPTFSGSIFVATSSANLKLSADTNRNNNNNGTVLVKNIRVNYAGVISVSFDGQGNGFGGQGRIYLNGVATGTLRSFANGSYTTYTENITIQASDYVQVYSIATAGAVTDIRNFRISFDLTDGGNGTVITD